MKFILERALDFFHVVSDKVVLFVSLVLGTVLTAIGYPKEILLFIFTTILIDIITKHYSIVVVNYGKFTLSNYRLAWKERNLTSRGLKNGIGVKAILYLPVLYLANKACVIPELIGGQYISNTIYTLLIVVEWRSIFENFEDCGYEFFGKLARLFSKKEEDLLDVLENDEEADASELKGEDK